MSKILLTGASGYLGKNLIQGFVDANHELVLLVRKSSDMIFLRNYTQPIKVYYIGSQTFDEIFRDNNIDIVIHTAASYGRKDETLKHVIDANLTFPIDLLTAAIKNDVKYFINTDTALPKTLNWYARSKKQFLEWLEESSSKINVINLQLEYFFGPNDDESKFITFVLKELQSGKTEIDFTEATSLRDFIFIDDVVKAYLLIVRKINNFSGLQTIQIGSGNAIQLRKIIIKIRELVNRKDVNLNFGAIPMRPNEIEKSCADITYLKNLGWSPEYSFEEGILKTIQK
ncbi:NAD-dependent epimerase/dehydratase family protein [Pedobacter cryotolerans]|uniref:NAD(P)-dependent oxidoreductase n=1 Tax=Pedobacter cryotolerans TaxID=2571270 RepID=A0A4U1CF33_9SPHI|nr:NAD(P)-dependent oxidoreductase [Pedobacter cryotolerans]TKC03490.1 NAD(P)-dependent oxidoreductase [Pedobacter cryotolerans]